MYTFKSDLSGKNYPENQKIRAASIRPAILGLMQADARDQIEYVSIAELDEYRRRYIEVSMKSEFEKLTSLEREVLEKLKNNELISKNIGKEITGNYTFGQKVADRVASFGGSWKFIIFFCTFIVVWILINLFAVFSKNYDPYPFILLNLMLSCLAALQAPVIMMSQNRAEDKDRQRAIEDYKINLKSEIEIQTLHEKIDHMIINQQGRMFEVQNIQIEMLKDIMEEISELKRK